MKKSKSKVNKEKLGNDRNKLKVHKDVTDSHSMDVTKVTDKSGKNVVLKNDRISIDDEHNSTLGFSSSRTIFQKLEDNPFDKKLKQDSEYLSAKVDSIINDLYHTDSNTIRLFQYYHGIRSNSKLSQLVAKDGLSNPMEMDFLSIIKPRVNVLLGVQKDHPMQYNVECSGNDLYFKEEEEEKDKILKEVYNSVRKTNLDTINKFEEELKERNKTVRFSDYFDAKTLQLDEKAYSEAIKSKAIHSTRILEKEIKNIVDETKKSFKSIIHQQSDLVLQTLQDKNKLSNKIVTWLKHLLICGKMYGRANFTHKGEMPKIDVLHPLFVYHPTLEEGQSVGDCPQAYYVKRMSKVDILNKYGHLMSIEQRKDFYNSNAESSWLQSDTTWSSAMYDSFNRNGADTLDNMYNAEIGSDFFSPSSRNPSTNKVYCNIYEVEWIEMNEREVNGKKVLVQDLYQAIRIGGPGGFYLDMGESDKAIRDVDNPLKTRLTIEGCTISDVDNIFSTLVGSIMNVQDKYDFINLLRENLLHNAHVGGISIDINAIPTYLGDDVVERIDKWMDNIRAGYNLVDPSQEGMTDPGGHYATKTFDSNLNPNLIQALDMVLDKYEQNAGDITGINRQMLGQFQERDGAAVTKQALAQASLQTKEWFSMLDYFIEIILTSSLNMARVSLTKGQTLSYTLGSKSKTFNINPNFNIVNYNVKVVDSLKEASKLERLRGFVQPLIESAGLSKEEVIEIAIADSAQQVYSKLQSIIEEQKLGQLNQSQGQVEQLQQQLEELSKELEKYQKMELDIKEREQDRADRKLFQESLHKLETRKLEAKKAEDKYKTVKERTAIEREEAHKGGRDSEVTNIEM